MRLHSYSNSIVSISPSYANERIIVWRYAVWNLHISIVSMTIEVVVICGCIINALSVIFVICYYLAVILTIFQAIVITIVALNVVMAVIRMTPVPPRPTSALLTSPLLPPPLQRRLVGTVPAEGLGRQGLRDDQGGSLRISNAGDGAREQHQLRDPVLRRDHRHHAVLQRQHRHDGRLGAH